MRVMHLRVKKREEKVKDHEVVVKDLEKQTVEDRRIEVHSL